MSATSSKGKGPRRIADLVARVIEPVTARRGFARAELIAVWPEIAGPLHAACTTPEKIVWPRHAEGEEPPAGTLFIRADGPRAIFVQHELPQIVERVNAFFGYRAVAQARVIQGPVSAAAREPHAIRAPDPAAERRVAADVEGIEDEGLRAALHRLGVGVLTKRRE